MSDIIFSIFSADDPFHPETKEPQTMIESGGWMDCEGEGTVIAKHICEYYFDDEKWDECYGLDDYGTVIVEVIEPTINAGFYEVDMCKVVKAEAHKVKDPRS